MADESQPKGVTAIYVYDGRVLATASDFARSAPGGYTLVEAQTHRAKQRLAVEVVRAIASPSLYENLDAYDCEKIVDKMKGSSYVVLIGHAANGTDAI